MAIPIEAVIFDMDGVIIDSELSNIKNLHQYVLTYNSAVTLEEMFDTVGRSAADCWERIRALMRDFRPWEEIRQEYRDTVKNELPGLSPDFPSSNEPGSSSIKNHGV